MLPQPKRSPNFARRLNQACDRSPECPPLHGGRLGWLQQMLAREGIRVSVESVRKWLAGEGRPKQDKSEKLAEILEVDAVWLYMGGSKARSEESLGNAELSGHPAPTLPIAIRQNHVVSVINLPLDLTRSEATKIANIILAHAVGD